LASKDLNSKIDVIIALVLKCNKCGHVWTPNQPLIPNYCPKCKRADWYK